MLVRKSLIFNSKGDNLRISQIKSSLVMFDYKILQKIFKCFSRPIHNDLYFSE